MQSGITPFTKLEELTFSSLPKLESIYWSPLPFPVLRRLNIVVCPNLKRLPLNATSVPQIGKFRITMYPREQEADLTWEDEDTKNRFLPLLRSGKSLLFPSSYFYLLSLFIFSHRCIKHAVLLVGLRNEICCASLKGSTIVTNVCFIFSSLLASGIAILETWSGLVTGLKEESKLLLLLRFLCFCSVLCCFSFGLYYWFYFAVLFCIVLYFFFLFSFFLHCVVLFTWIIFSIIPLYYLKQIATFSVFILHIYLHMVLGKKMVLRLWFLLPSCGLWFWILIPPRPVKTLKHTSNTYNRF